MPRGRHTTFGQIRGGVLPAGYSGCGRAAAAMRRPAWGTRAGGPGYRPRLDLGHGRRPCPAVMSASTLRVLVTGGTSGLGLAMASALAAAGARVALTGRSAAQAAAVAAELPGAAGLGMDVREESSVARAVSQA